MNEQKLNLFLIKKKCFSIYTTSSTSSSSFHHYQHSEKFIGNVIFINVMRHILRWWNFSFSLSWQKKENCCWPLEIMYITVWCIHACWWIWCEWWWWWRSVYSFFFLIRLLRLICGWWLCRNCCWWWSVAWHSNWLRLSDGYHVLMRFSERTVSSCT